MKPWSLLVVAALAPGCARELRRTPGEDCSAVGVVFREARGGVGPEFSHLVGGSGYIACPADGTRVPARLERAWESANQNVFVFQSAAVEKVPDARPIGAKVVDTWTQPEDGVLYKYAAYTLIFHACDFWYSPYANTKCALPISTPTSAAL